MQYLTCRIKQNNDGTTEKTLSAFMEDRSDANAQYWTMVGNDINNSNVLEFADFVIDTDGNIGKKRYYTRTDAEQIKFYQIKIEVYTDDSNKLPVKQIFEFSDRDSAEVAYCKDNANAEKDTTILTAAHLIVNHHVGVELSEFYDYRPVPAPEVEPESQPIVNDEGLD